MLHMGRKLQIYSEELQANEVSPWQSSRLYNVEERLRGRNWGTLATVPPLSTSIRLCS